MEGYQGKVSHIPIIERMVFDSLACDRRQMLMAARDKLGSDVHAKERMREECNEESQEGMIAAMHGDAVFQIKEQREDNELIDNDEYVDIGDHQIEKKLIMTFRNVFAKLKHTVCKQMTRKN